MACCPYYWVLYKCWLYTIHAYQEVWRTLPPPSSKVGLKSLHSKEILIQKLINSLFKMADAFFSVTLVACITTYLLFKIPTVRTNEKRSLSFSNKDRQTFEYMLCVKWSFKYSMRSSRTDDRLLLFIDWNIKVWTIRNDQWLISSIR